MLAIAAAGCSDVGSTGSNEYIAGDGQIVLRPAAEREEPIELVGTTLEGDAVDLADLRGKPVVINMWWSGCAPCRTEMPLLVDASKKLSGEAEFLGINIRDLSTDQAELFAAKYKVPYPSIHDPNGEALLAFHGELSPRTIPTTVVLDEQGRIGATFRGEVPTVTTLVDAVREVSTADG